MCLVTWAQCPNGLDPALPVISPPLARTLRHVPMGQWAPSLTWIGRRRWNPPLLPAQTPAGRHSMEISVRTVFGSGAPIPVATAPVMATSLGADPLRPLPKIEIAIPIARHPPGNVHKTVASMRKVLGDYALMAVAISPPISMISRRTPFSRPPKMQITAIIFRPQITAIILSSPRDHCGIKETGISPFTNVSDLDGFLPNPKSANPCSPPGTLCLGGDHPGGSSL